MPPGFCFNGYDRLVRLERLDL